MTIPVFFKLSDAVKVLGPGSPCEDTLRAEVKAGRLRARRIGRCLRVSDVELTRWVLGENQISPAGPEATVSSSAATAPAPGGKS